MMAGDFLNYLLNGEPGILHGKIFADRSIWGAVPYVREGYAYQCFRSMVSLMINYEIKNPNLESKLFPRIFADLEFDVHNLDRQIIHDWLCIKKQFLSGDWENFVNGFIEFMDEPKCKLYDILKINSFMDVIKLVESSSYRRKSDLMRIIGQYLESNFNLDEYRNRDISAANLVHLDPG